MLHIRLPHLEPFAPFTSGDVDGGCGATGSTMIGACGETGDDCIGGVAIVGV